MEQTIGNIIRTITLGHVDDGKSTLIGRLLFDSKVLFEDLLLSLEQASIRKGNRLDLSMVTDGLRDERELGITIDVAYRYFSTPQHRFILIDSPGHEEYTRNMVTGASNANIAIIMVDVRNGMQIQTKRHLFIANLLGIDDFVVCINKMDLVDYKEENYKNIVSQFELYKRSWGLPNLHYIPMSALQGDNVVEQSTKMPWYKNKTLIKTLMDIPSTKNQDQGSFRLPIQYIFPNSQNKIVSGRISSGKLKIGDQLKLMRTGETVIVESILNPTLPVLEGGAGLSVTIHLDSTISINRGDILVHPNSPTKNGNNIESILCWLDANQWDSTKTYILQHQQKEIMARISNILYIQNINHPNIKDLSNHIGMNDIANVTLELKESLYFDSYKENHVTGSFILIDPITNHTVAAGLIQ